MIPNADRSPWSLTIAASREDANSAEAGKTMDLALVEDLDSHTSNVVSQDATSTEWQLRAASSIDRLVTHIQFPCPLSAEECERMFKYTHHILLRLEKDGVKQLVRNCSIAKADINKIP